MFIVIYHQYQKQEVHTCETAEDTIEKIKELTKGNASADLIVVEGKLWDVRQTLELVEPTTEEATT